MIKIHINSYSIISIRQSIFTSNIKKGVTQLNQRIKTKNNIRLPLFVIKLEKEDNEKKTTSTNVDNNLLSHFRTYQLTESNNIDKNYSKLSNRKTTKKWKH